MNTHCHSGCVGFAGFVLSIRRYLSPTFPAPCYTRKYRRNTRRVIPVAPAASPALPDAHVDAVGAFTCGSTCVCLRVGTLHAMPIGHVLPFACCAD